MKHFLNETSQKLMSKNNNSLILEVPKHYQKNNTTYAKKKKIISETDLFDSMKSMKNNKTPGNDGLTKEFYEIFWDELKTPLMESVNQAFHTEILSISQRQAVIKLIEKKTGINVI